MQTAHNIYIHVPFCASKCRYCAFYSRAIAPDWDGYLAGILSELDYWAARLGRIDVPTVFFGGGTPSLMPTRVFAAIMDKIRTDFNLAFDAEITLESNPGTIDAVRISEFKAAGVNRLSIGVQSLSDDELEFLGRRHNTRDAIAAIDAGRRAGLRTSADFIYGLPGHTVGDVVRLCRDINALGLSHCSMYELSIEAGTPFAQMNLAMPDNDTMAEMYMAISDNLNLPRYEVSNYATSGDECRHNANIWAGAPYIGIGRAAAGRVLIDGTWYDQMGAGARCEKLSSDVRAVEKVMTGMRTIRGVELTDDVRAAINWDWVTAHPDLVDVSLSRISARPAGLLTLDNILLELIG
ncbi:radical SAM family heme chaperone HemW [bacterium]|nr:radical SAM family heme chaperone HemW [bacterium]